MHLKKSVTAIASGLAILAATGQSALAHLHLFNDLGSPSMETAYQVGDVTYQHGMYGALSAPGAINFYRVDLAEARSFSVWLVVPNSEACQLFRPQIALIGSAVGELTAVGSVPLPEGMSAGIASSPFWGRYVDPDTRLTYFAGPRLFPQLEAGTYYFAVLDVEGRTGSYMLLIGDQDSPGGDPNWQARAVEHHACVPGLVG